MHQRYTGLRDGATIVVGGELELIGNALNQGAVLFGGQWRRSETLLDLLDSIVRNMDFSPVDSGITRGI